MTLFQAIADRTSSSCTTGMTCTTCAASINKSLTKTLYAEEVMEYGIWNEVWSYSKFSGLKKGISNLMN